MTDKQKELLTTIENVFFTNPFKFARLREYDKNVSVSVLTSLVNAGYVSVIGNSYGTRDYKLNKEMSELDKQIADLRNSCNMLKGEISHLVNSNIHWGGIAIKYGVNTEEYNKFVDELENYLYAELNQKEAELRELEEKNCAF